MKTEVTEDYGLPKDKLFFSLSEIKGTGLMSIEQAKQKLYAGDLKGVKNGAKWLITREELIRYITEDMSPNGKETVEEPLKRAGHVYKRRSGRVLKSEE